MPPQRREPHPMLLAAGVIAALAFLPLPASPMRDRRGAPALVS